MLKRKYKVRGRDVLESNDDESACLRMQMEVKSAAVGKRMKLDEELITLEREGNLQRQIEAERRTVWETRNVLR